MNEYKVTTYSEEETLAVAQNIESEKFPNMIITLSGDLGSGKTVFTKGIAHGLGIDDITSPTFNIIKEYEGELPLYHMDVYRLEGNIDNIGLTDYFTKGGVVVIEWADMIKDYLPNDRLDIKIKIVDENTRVLIFTPHGEKYEMCRSVHAEMNAIISAARKDMIGSTLYLVGFEDGHEIVPTPCSICERMIKNSGIYELITHSGFDLSKRSM